MKGRGLGPIGVGGEGEECVWVSLFCKKMVSCFLILKNVTFLVNLSASLLLTKCFFYALHPLFYGVFLYTVKPV